MNRYLFSLIAALLVGLAGAYFYRHHGLAAVQSDLAAVRARLPGAAVAVQPKALEVQCGCEPPEVIHEPTTPREIRQEKINEKQEAREEELHDKQIMLRLHRLVQIGTSKQQVERLMGEPDMSGSPIAAENEHPADDADYYGNIEVAYAANGTVTWIGSI